ncbi:hypothetical protein A2526_06505 [candidate division WOR-1 bacterium RIFOXYD2_FULL_36_8]|uniref:Bacterial type II secretion system protein E domain-containing protein n=1 Tax=candidate division WOR-1 bacterium RIFOXYB2_FULL_36_35 TaxID=1802578 RepID=A0A1F4S3P1_UNCSA|nr:MAG: hypothetical protein A2230_09055 [candidate division WOR-1 bacterium RIFOXYA2_FULL_36_21]OGC15019.1 MAG: hypothetical protein A2290_01695 [candidate division WOR-1 bacterium RIFOXYB2_FULL_36_35]OGC18726.1 MAG: hypothetical protein A2282_07475 [candidate division WOR-1 bacterium RIFOXYA12_FULL_36_13]OGC41767.1 MAG: hypothetical protein A2526_06505 [candidate division WOR-1 bacterium RIFOXYD2_FULL_36_8]
MRKKVEKIILNAIERGASDIHIEPREEFTKIRVRTDGLIADQETFPKDEHPAIVASTKVMVGLDIAESRIPQDGRYKIKFDKDYVDFRISTLPTIHGEKVVIRILQRDKTKFDLLRLGFNPEDLDLYRKMINKKSGMVLVTGPTGSGKTTTLYATLKELNSKENNIVTIEDPVEYQLPGINQVQVNYKTGFDFSKILRAVLRQDPDIILVGEIRDFETAKVAVQAALTGHMVLGTLHTRDASSAFTRLVDLGIEEYLVKDVLVGIIAQRLLRVKPSGRRAIFEIATDCSGVNRRRLKDEALRLLAEGITTKEEIFRVIDID